MAEEQGDMKKRLVQFATEHLGITIHRFEKSCGLSNSYCSNPNAVGTYAQKKIISTYPELSMDWVVTGKGDMLISKNSSTRYKAHTSITTEVKEDSIAFNLVKEELSTTKRELELYKMLYEKERAETKAMSEQIGALKSELDGLKKEDSEQRTESVNVKRKRKVS
jgi:hypothetical protein